MSLAISTPTELDLANIPCCKKCFSQHFQATTSWNSLSFTLFQDVTRFHNNLWTNFLDLTWLWNFCGLTLLLCLSWCVHAFVYCMYPCVFVSALMCSPVQRNGCVECCHFKLLINQSIKLSDKHYSYDRHIQHQEHYHKSII